jgi:hypothetical protein
LVSERDVESGGDVDGIGYMGNRGAAAARKEGESRRDASGLGTKRLQLTTGALASEAERCWMVQLSAFSWATSVNAILVIYYYTLGCRRRGK